jgi:hypothetical protein
MNEVVPAPAATLASSGRWLTGYRSGASAYLLVKPGSERLTKRLLAALAPAADWDLPRRIEVEGPRPQPWQECAVLLPASFQQAPKVIRLAPHDRLWDWAGGRVPDLERRTISLADRPLSQADKRAEADGSPLFSWVSPPPSVPRAALPAVRCDDEGMAKALLEEPGLTWGRSVYSPPLALGRLLAQAGHPGVYLGPAPAHFPPGRPVDHHTRSRSRFLCALADNSLFLSMTVPEAKAHQIGAIRDRFSRVFPPDAFFASVVSVDTPIKVDLCHPALPEPLGWTLQQSAQRDLVAGCGSDPGEFPIPLQSRQDFLSWAFARFPLP